MGWSGGNYTKGNAATGGWVGDASLGIGIEAGRHDTQDNDFATGINQCLNKDGSNAATGNLNLGGFLPTNLGAGTAAAPALCMNNDVNTGFFSPAADQIGIATNGTERIRINTTGQLGLGTSNPSVNLDIQGISTITKTTRFSADTIGPYHDLQKSRGATVGTNTIVQNGDILGVLRFNGANGTDFTEGAYVAAFVDGTPGATNDMPTRLVFATTADGGGIATERMRLTSTGRLGFGTNAPVGLMESFSASTDNSNPPQLMVRGLTTASSGSGRAALNFDVDGNGGFYIENNATSGTRNLIIGGNSGWGASNTELLRITSGGFVGIGRTPTFMLHLNSDSAAKPTTNTWTISSDQRLKTNIQPYTKGLAEVCQIKPITYDYNGKGGIPAGPGGVSILAQEMQPIFPECIGSYKAKLNDDDAEETEILNYNGHAITFALINAIKELNAKVEVLEAKVAALES